MNYLISVLIIFSAYSCKSTAKLESNNKSIVAQTGARNSVFILGVPGVSSSKGETNEEESTFLYGVKSDVDKYTSLFNSSRFSHFKVYSLYDPANIDAVFNKLREAVSHIDENGTLVLVYTGHGLAGSGDWDLGPDSIGLRDFYRIIREVRTTKDQSGATKFKPLQRIVVISDSCYSGALAEGQAQALQERTTIIGTVGPENQAARLANALSKDKDGLAVAKEVIIIASADKLNKSYDIGLKWGRGGKFSYYFEKSFRKFEASNQESTLGDWINDAVSSTNGYWSGTKQRPTFFVSNESLLNEYIFRQGGKNGGVISKTQPSQECVGAYGYDWAVGQGQLGATKTCLNALSYCQCWPAENKALADDQTIWGLFSPNSQAGDAPLVSTLNESVSSVFRVKDARMACSALAKKHADLFKTNCNNKMLLLNSDSLLELYPN